jgi:NAD(P)-dependent dehydrogenase (short-subunit alcohol dehydrogenase family)
VSAEVRFGFEGKVAIVTGAARGVGREIVRAFVDAGANVVAADRDGDGLASTAASHGERVAAIVADISTPEGAKAIVDRATAEFGRLDVCVNNAAVAPHAALLDERVEVWDRVYAVNCRGTFLMTQAAARAMIAGGGGGRIINFSSGAAQRGGAGGAAYASSRAATETFSRVAAVELAPHEILVNTISPGLIDTQPKPLPPNMAERLAARIPNLPLARPGRPEEVAQLVLFLASDRSSYISGAVISIDGASSAGSRFSGVVVDDDTRYDWVTGRARSKA